MLQTSLRNRKVSAQRAARTRRERALRFESLEHRQLLATITAITPGPDDFVTDMNAAGDRLVLLSSSDLTGGNPDHSQEVFLYNRTTNGYTQLSSTTSSLPSRPKMNAAGNLVVFGSTGNYVAENPEGNPEIFLYDDFDGSIVQITHTSAGVSHFPDISDDGSTIVFESNANHAGANNPDGNVELFHYDVASGMLKQLTNTTGGINTDAVVNANGTRVAYLTNTDPLNATPSPDNAEVFLLDVATLAITQLTNTPVGVNAGRPAINPAGTQVAFTAQADLTGGNADLSREVFVATVNGSVTYQQVTGAGTPAGDIVGNPTFAGSGGVVTYVIHQQDSEVEISLVDLPSNQKVSVSQPTFGAMGILDMVNADAQFRAAMWGFASNAGDTLTFTSPDANGTIAVRLATEVQPRMIVNSNGDAADNDPGDGVCSTGALVSGVLECTLRAAIQEANARPNVGSQPDRVEFDIFREGPHLIQLMSPLPAITDPIIIDGFTEPGAVPTTNAFPLPLNPTLQIDIDGRNLTATGLDVVAGDSTIRGLTLRNFTQQAMLLRDGGSNVLEGNYIGTNLAGNFAFGNGGVGIEIRNSSDNRIGGIQAAQRNLVSGSGGAGILINATDGVAERNIVQGNFIGASASGLASLGNQHGIVVASATQTLIGGPVAEAGNLISGNTHSGLTLNSLGAAALAATVQHNLIGVDRLGGDLGNQAIGILVNSSANRLEDNTVAFTKSTNGLGVGIGLGAGTGNALLRNRVFSNAELGIDLADGTVTPNDPGDSDVGPNNLQNFPVLSSVSMGSNPVINGTLNSRPNTAYRIELFRSDAADPSGHGEGQEYLGFINVATDNTGNAPIQFTSAVAIPGGSAITATATRLDATNSPIETSEFSAAIISNTNLAPTDIELKRTDLFRNIAGAWIGRVHVTDPNAGDSFTYSFSDNRFEIREGNLYLKPGAIIASSGESSVNLQITAFDSGGLPVSRTFVLDVVTPPAVWDCPHQWAPNPFDVDVDGFITPLDTALITNVLNATGVYQVSAAVPGTLPAPFLNVSCDAYIDGTDAVVHSNYINANGVGSASGEGEFVTNRSPLATNEDANRAATEQATAPAAAQGLLQLNFDNAAKGAAPTQKPASAAQAAIAWDQLGRGDLPLPVRLSPPEPARASTIAAEALQELDWWDWLWSSEEEA
jgi:CSLREA domain-containing protein